MQIPLHVSALFIALVFSIAFIILITVYAGSNRLNLPARKKGKYFIITGIGLLAWLTFTLVIAISGLPQQVNAPALLAIVIIPPALLLIALLFAPSFKLLLSTIDVHWIIYLQSFRILLELIFFMLYRYKAIPADITPAGRNFDILIGLSAPVVAWYCFKLKKGAQAVGIIWNLVGIAGVINLLVMLALPRAGDTSLAYNHLVFSFPYIWSPAFAIPLALFLHLAAIKKLLGLPPTARAYLKV